MSKKVLKRGSAEERWYYTTKEGLDSVDIDDDFDWRRGMELLFEDARKSTGSIAAWKTFRCCETQGSSQKKNVISPVTSEQL